MLSRRARRDTFLLWLLRYGPGVFERTPRRTHPYAVGQTDCGSRGTSAGWYFLCLLIFARPRIFLSVHPGDAPVRAVFPDPGADQEIGTAHQPAAVDHCAQAHTCCRESVSDSGNHAGICSADARVALYVSRCRRSRMTSIFGARVGSTGFCVMRPSTIASLNISDSTERIASAIVFFPSTIHGSRNSAICRVVTSASIFLSM